MRGKEDVQFDWELFVSTFYCNTPKSKENEMVSKKHVYTYLKYTTSDMQN
jgi:hypothetical protein